MSLPNLFFALQLTRQIDAQVWTAYECNINAQLLSTRRVCAYHGGIPQVTQTHFPDSKTVSSSKEESNLLSQLCVSPSSVSENL